MTVKTTRRHLLASAVVVGSALPFASASRLLAAPAGPGSPLERNFLNPPQAARPRVWWHWMGGNVSVEGARLDLEWMQRVGIGGVHAFSGGGLPSAQVVKPPVPFMSPTWQEATRRSLDQALKAGMEFGIAGSPGWHVTGGPWVAPADGMKKYVWSELQVEGGRPLTIKLPQPPATTGPFQTMPGGKSKATAYGDAAVIAFPTPKRERPLPAARWTSSQGEVDITPAAGDELNSKGVTIARSGEGTWLEVELPSAALVGAVVLSIKQGARVQVLAMDAGGAVRALAQADVHQMGEGDDRADVQRTIAFAPTTARRLRITLEPLPAEHDTELSKVNKQPQVKAFTIVQARLIGGARVNGWEAKAGFAPTFDPEALRSPTSVEGTQVDGGKVLDLTDKLGADGTLDWTPPRGKWTILRFGWSLTGTVNGPAETVATGLEVDKFDPAAVRRYLQHYLGLYEQATGRKVGPTGVQTLLTDSWESRVQNWTPAMLSAIRERRGFDPLRFLPVLAGRIVDDAETSERFLFDFRQTLKDLLADNHYGTIAAELKSRGMTYYSEAEGDSPRAIADGMAIKARADIPTAEFWYRPFSTKAGQPPLKADLEEAASVGHVYGKPIVAAEALTVAALNDAWAFSPAMLKPVADEIFARGINRLLLHESHHQPLVDKKPGLQLFLWGQYFNRNDTWAEDAAPWVTYLARTSQMLQQGTFVADVAYFYGEERNLTELFEERINSEVPGGYKYDYINAEALLMLLSVRDGRIVTPSGMSYAVLFLPDHVERISLPVARKLRELVSAGAVLAGRKPVGGVGLGSPDAEVLAIVDALWSSAGGMAGDQRVYPGLEQAFAAKAIAPDIAIEGQWPADLLFLHRRITDGEVYFLSNQSAAPLQVSARFRVSGYAPEIWHADSGSSERASYRQVGAVTQVPLALDPHEALFVVFRKRTNAESWTAPQVERTEMATLSGPWSVSFDPALGGSPQRTFDRLTSWPESDDPGIKYYSGPAFYRQTITVTPAQLRGRRIELDLGEVRDLAVVQVNGRRMGTAWKPPFRLDITEALKPGRNQLEIKVVNLWPNRLIGDRQPGAQPIAFAPDNRYSAKSPLLPSGLLGPVRLLTQPDPRLMAPT